MSAAVVPDESPDGARGHRRGAGDQRQPRPGLRLLRPGPRLVRADHPAVLEASGFHIDGERRGRRARSRATRRHLIIRSVLVGLADLGVVGTGLGLECHNTIPHGREVWVRRRPPSSRGWWRRRALAGRDPDPAWMLRHANAIEGHPDNVAAAIYGGFVLAYEGRDGVASCDRVGWPLDLASRSSFRRSRGGDQGGARPAAEPVPHVDAAANAGRAALLVDAMAGRTDPALGVDARLVAPGVPRAGHAAVVRAGEPSCGARDWRR